MARARDALKIIDRVAGKNTRVRRLIERETLNSRVASLIYTARVRAGLTQKQLADLVGTKQPVIARLEHAEYRGHSLSMLQRIARALDKRLDVRFLPSRSRGRAA